MLVCKISWKRTKGQRTGVPRNRMAKVNRKKTSKSRK